MTQNPINEYLKGDYRCEYCKHYNDNDFCKNCCRNMRKYSDYFRLDTHLEAYLKEMNGVKDEK